MTVATVLTRFSSPLKWQDRRPHLRILRPALGRDSPYSKSLTWVLCLHVCDLWLIECCDLFELLKPQTVFSSLNFAITQIMEMFCVYWFSQRSRTKRCRKCLNQCVGLAHQWLNYSLEHPGRSAVLLWYVITVICLNPIIELWSLQCSGSILLWHQWTLYCYILLTHITNSWPKSNSIRHISEDLYCLHIHLTKRYCITQAHALHSLLTSCCSAPWFSKVDWLCLKVHFMYQNMRINEHRHTLSPRVPMKMPLSPSTWVHMSSRGPTADAAVLKSRASAPCR